VISNRQYFLNHVAQTSSAPLLLEVERAEGCYLYDKEGKAYLDLIAGISVSSVGHSHPKVIEAVTQQVKKHMHTLVYGEFIQSSQVELAKFLCNKLPETLNNIYYVNSGTEATEGAMKLAKRYTGRGEILSCFNAYHGSTQGALSILGDESFKQSFRPLLPDCRLIHFNNFDDLQKISKKTACVVMEPIQAEAGVILPENNYLQAVRKRCDEVGALLVFDEIQTGCGRTGSFFAFEQYGIVPDILLLAKAFGGGMPLGAFISSKEIMQSLSNNPVLGHISTFGGHPVSCAASLAALTVLDSKGYIEEVKSKSQLFLEKLKHPEIKKVTAAGLLMAIHLDSFEQVLKVQVHCLHNGIITDWFLFASNCIRIAPPLTINEQEINIACEIVLEALNTL
jgi:acetylornithine/succinyldiaminopimelate/putrescine aminotransferase